MTLPTTPSHPPFIGLTTNLTTNHSMYVYLKVYKYIQAGQYGYAYAAFCLP